MILNNLQIKSFRGATKPVIIDFDKTKKITMIFAENGNGKSTISDAFICLLSEKKGTLDDKSSVDFSFLKSIGAGNGTSNITLSTDVGNFSASLTGAAKAFVKNPVSGHPSFRSLRRSQIINLMNAQASGRYETLKEFIDVSGILASEIELGKVKRETATSFTNTASVLLSAQETLEKAWKKEGKPEGDILIWAKKQSETDLSIDKKHLLTLNSLTNQWRAIEAKALEIKNTEAALKITLQELKSASEAFEKVKLENANNNAALLKLLNEAKSFISSQAEISTCPICASAIIKNDIIVSLSQQISTMDALDKAAKLVESTKKYHDKNKTISENAIANLSTLLIKYKDSISGYKTQLTDIVAFVDNITNDAKNNFACYSDNLQYLTALSARILESESKKNTAIEQHNIIKTHYSNIIANHEKLEKLGKLSNAADKALQIVESERKAYFDNELLSISGDIEQMYQKLHAQESLGGIKLFLNPNYRTSLELKADFYEEKGITPQSVYSESHLDTLGICIFLALAKKNSDGNTILVLDDVVMSVDEKHLDKFIELLHDEVDNFGQIIITTHFRPWRDRYRYHRAPGGKVHFIELRKWSKDTGIRVQNGRIELQELEIVLNDSVYFDRQGIASKSGIILENLLDYLTDTYEYYVPKRKNLKYTLGELIDTLQPKYLKNLKVVHITKSLDASGNEIDSEAEYPIQPIIEDLKKLLFIRNQVGAHFNIEQDASDDDVEMFGKKTLELGKLLVCNETGQLPLTKSIDHWKSKNGTVKLFPSEKI